MEQHNNYVPVVFKWVTFKIAMCRYSILHTWPRWGEKHVFPGPEWDLVMVVHIHRAFRNWKSWCLYSKLCEVFYMTKQEDTKWIAYNNLLNDLEINFSDIQLIQLTSGGIWWVAKDGLKVPARAIICKLKKKTKTFFCTLDNLTFTYLEYSFNFAFAWLLPVWNLLKVVVFIDLHFRLVTFFRQP